MSPKSRPQPVLFLESRLHHGGDVQVLIDLLSVLDPTRYTLHVACVPGGAIEGRANELPPGVHLHRLGFGYAPSPLGRIRSLVGTVRALRSLVVSEGIRAVHSNNTKRTLSAAVLLKTVAPRRVRLAYHAHCEPQGSLAHRAALRLSTQVWCVSGFVRSAYLASGVPARKLVPMANSHSFGGPAPSDRPAADVRAEWAVPDEARLAVLVGRLSPVKGQHLAVRVLADDRLPPDLVLALVGDDAIEDRNEGYRQSLIDLAVALGVRDRLVLAGFTPDPAPCYAAADVVLILSHREPFGLVALEAAAAMRPIVATRSGGLIEILGETAGLPLADEEAGAIADRVAAALADEQAPSPALVRERLADRYGRDAFTERVEQALQALDPFPPGLGRAARPEEVSA